MIAVSTPLATAMLAALVQTLGAAMVELHNTTRPTAGAMPAGSAIATITLANPVGEVGGGVLTLTPSDEGQLLLAGSPLWARVYGTGGAWMFDCDARLSGDPDTGQELVVEAPALYPGAFVRITGGTLFL